MRFHDYKLELWRVYRPKVVFVRGYHRFRYGRLEYINPHWRVMPIRKGKRVLYLH